VRTCSTCGLTLPRGSAESGCPHCLLQLALWGGDAPEPESGSTSALPPPSAGRFFGDYELLDEVARGGMGVIYRARQISLGRTVALKMVHPGQLASPEAQLRFRMEIEAAAQLNHPHIVPMFESGDVVGTHFFTMRLMEGGHLGKDIAQHVPASRPKRSRSRSHPFLLPGFSTQDFIAIVRAVQHAHQRGVLHRDLKPSNILLDEAGRPHVSDFGLAKLLTQDGGLTQSLSILGSPAYMAPEQAAGETASLTVGTDVYGLGAILYELLTGVPPFRASTPLETLRMVSDEDPVPPRTLDAEVDPDLETICLKCLRKAAGQRYESAEALARDLERWMEDRSILARPQGRMERVWRWCRRNPLAATGAVALTIAVIAGTVATNLAAWKIRSANQRTESLLRRMQLQRADELLSEGETSRGLAILAHLVRQDPHTTTTITRLQSAIESRGFYLPETETAAYGATFAATILQTNRSAWLALTMEGKLGGWDLSSGKPKPFANPLSGPVMKAHFGPEGRTLVLGLTNGQVELRAGPDLGTRVELPHHRGNLEAAAISASGTLGASSSRLNTLMIWNTADGELIGPQRSVPSPATGLAFSPDERWLAAACADGVVRLWEARAGESAPSLSLPNPSGRILRFSSDGRWLAVGGYEGGIHIWQMNSSQKPRWRFQHKHRISDMDFDPSGQRLITASYDDTAQIWSLADGARVGAPLRHSGRVNSARFSPDGKRVVTGSSDGSARVWAADTGLALSGQLNQAKPVDSVYFLQDSRRVLSTTYFGSTMIWRELAPKHPPTTIRHEGAVVGAALSHDGSRVFTVDRTPVLRAFDSASGASLGTTRMDAPLVSVAVEPSDHWIAVGTTSGNIHLLELPELRLRQTFSSSRESVRTLQFSTDGSRLLALHWAHAQMWNTETSAPVGPALRHTEQVRHASLSADGKSVLTSGNDLAVKHWMPDLQDTPVNTRAGKADVQMTQLDPTSTRLLLIPSGNHPLVMQLGSDSSNALTLPHGAPANFGAFDATGGRVVTVSDDQTAKVWNIGRSAELVQTIPHRGRVRWAAFGPESTLVTATANGRFQVWDIRTGESLTDAIDLPAPWAGGDVSLAGRKYLAVTREGTVVVSHFPAWTGSTMQAIQLAGDADRLARIRFTPPDVFQPTQPGE
jgi:WD40 repeat protein